MSDLLRSLAKVQLLAVAELRTLSRPGAFEAALVSLGHDEEVTAAVVVAFDAALDALSAIDDLAERLIYGTPSLEDVPGLIDEMVDLVTAAQGLVPSTSGLPPPFDSATFWSDLALELVEQAFLNVLGRRLPVAELIALVTGLVRVDDRGVESLDLDAIGRFLGDPTGTLGERFGLRSAFWSERLGATLLARLHRLGLDVSIDTLSQDEVDGLPEMTLEAGQPVYQFRLLSGRLASSGARREAGLRLLPAPEHGELGLGLFASGLADGTMLPVGRSWQVALGLDADSLAQLVIVDAREPRLVVPDLDASATWSRTVAEPLLLFGDADGTRLEVADVAVRLALSGATASPECELAIMLDGLALHVVPGDTFLSELIGGDVDASVDLDLAWSSRSGVTLGASGSLSVSVPLGVTLGPVTLADVEFALTPSGDGAAVTATTGILAELGPFAVDVSRMGIEATLLPAVDGHGLIGPFDVAFGAKPPTRIGFSVMLEAVQGGGFVEIDEHRYSGVIMLKVMSVGIAAITVVDTALPDDPEGWAFFAALTLEFPAIPLGFGFTLSGLGGLVALNRGIDAQAIATGLKSGVVDALLFPDDPVDDAQTIIGMIDDYFPILRGNTVIGPIVEIGWGAPKTLITAQLGVVISHPEGKIVLFGSVAALLPDPNAPLLELNLDIIGEINVPDGTLFMQASLYDSRLLGTLELSGDMGTFLATQGQPYFLMSVGGFHPGFEPPSLVPPSLHDLVRMTAAIEVAEDVSVALTCYFAVTSNTVQFGAGVSLEASVKVTLTTYTAIGYFGFDVLLRFSPFALIAGFAAGVGVYSGSKELMGVHLEAHLEGPEPWYVTGQASFKFFGINVNFEVEVGDQAGSEPKEIVHLADELEAALSSPAAWKELPPASATLSRITYVDIEPEPGEDPPLWIRPDHRVAVAQGVVPLNRTIDIVGQGLPAAGDSHFAVTGAGFDEGETTADYSVIQDWFAPANFETMSNKERLERASFEEMDAGVSFGGGDVATTQDPARLGREVELDYEDVLFENVPPGGLVLPSGYLLAAARSGSASRRLATTEAKRAPLFAVSEPVFTVVSEVDAVPAAETPSTPGLTGVGVNQHAALAAAAAVAESAGDGVRVVSAATAAEVA